MNRKLEIWSAALADYYFFSNQSENACFEINKKDLAEVYSFAAPFINNPSRFDGWGQDDYIRDFAKCFMEEDSLPQNPNAKSYRPASRECFWSGFRSSLRISDAGKPMFLPYIALFIMPITDDEITEEGHRLDRYYDYLNMFADNIGIKSSRKNGNGKEWAFNFAPYGQELQTMWNLLEQWSDCTAGIPKWKKKTGFHNHIHIRPFFAECVLSSSQKARMPWLFYESKAPVGSVISREFANAAIRAHGQICLGFSPQYWEANCHDDSFLAAITDAFMNTYPKWDGSGRVIVRRNVGGQERKQESNSGTRLGVRLCYYDLDGIACFSFKAYKKDFSETITTDDGTRLRFTRSGWAKEAFSESVNSFLESGSDMIELLSMDDYSATFSRCPLYIFENNPDGTWVSVNRIRKGERLTVLAHSEAEDGIARWLEQNNAQALNPDGIAQGFSLYFIEKLTAGSDCMPCLKIPDSIRVEMTKGVELSHSGFDITLSLSGDVCFDIDGIDPSASHVSAKSENGSAYELAYSDESHLWILPSKNIKDGETLRLEINGSYPDRHSYIFVSPFITEITLPRKDIYGRESDSGEFKGLEGNYTIDNINLNRGTPVPDELSQIYSQADDAFLYDLSTVGTLKKEDFIRIAEAHLKDDDVSPYYPGVISEFEKSGFIETTYNRNDGLSIFVIPPTLVMVPNEFRLDTSSGLRMIQPVDGYYTGLILGARSRDLIRKIDSVATEIGVGIDFGSSAGPLLPINISVHSRQWQDFKKLADETGMIYHGNSYYCAAVLRSLPDILSYFHDVVLASTPITKYPDDNSFKGYSCLDYRAIADALTDRIAGNPQRKRSFKRNSFNPELDLVTYPDETVLWYKGLEYVVDKYWGHLIICALKGISNIVQINPSDGLSLCVPQEIRLPNIVSRALTLVTGRLPEEINQVRTYHLVDNPYMECAKAKSIISKLTVQTPCQSI